jgi:predicted DNA-binding protein with PD1-like motif
MARFHPVKVGRCLLGRLQYNTDLLGELTNVCVHEKINTGIITAIGALQKAKFAYFDQAARIYHTIAIDKPVELLNLSGNVSLMDGKPFIHAHIMVADETGQTSGGHLTVGTPVFACEFFIREVDGPLFERHLDLETSLSLWNVSLR